MILYMMLYNNIWNLQYFRLVVVILTDPIFIFLTAYPRDEAMTRLSRIIIIKHLKMLKLLRITKTNR